MSNSLLKSEVSVVLCSYNGERFIEEQIRSILNQTYPLKEILVIDDCSTDNTIAVVQELADQNPVLSVHQNEFNIGFNKNFEKALKLATGEIIAISDQDDVWHQRKIEILLERWKDPSLLIYCNSTVFQNKIPKHPKPNKLMKRIEGKDPRKLSFYNTVSGHTMLIKKELVALSLPFETDVYYDWWMSIVASCNKGISHESSVLVYQRAHEHNVTLKAKSNSISEYKSMLLPHLKKFQSAPNLQDRYKIFFQKFYTLIFDSLENRNKWALFLFLWSNRKTVFFYKKRAFGIISHLKNSYRLAFKGD